MTKQEYIQWLNKKLQSLYEYRDEYYKSKSMDDYTLGYYQGRALLLKAAIEMAEQLDDTVAPECGNCPDAPWNKSEPFYDTVFDQPIQEIVWRTV